MSVPCGVPNSCSNRSAAQRVACGRNEKMPPPSLSTTTMRRSARRCRSAVSAPASWTNAMSPSTTIVGAPVCSATPRAVDVTPSMPLAPRLACAVAPTPPNHSMSRIGIEAATTTCDAAGTVAGDEAGDAGSLSGASGPRNRSMAAVAVVGRGGPPAAPATRRRRRAAPRRARASTAASSCAATRWSGSMVPGPPTCTTVAPDPATHWARTFDDAGRPSRTTTVGALGGEPARGAAGRRTARRRRARRDGGTRRRRAAASRSPSRTPRRPRGTGAGAGEHEPAAAAQRVDDGVGRSRRPTDSAGARSPAGAAAADRRRHERLAERQVEVHGPSAAAATARAPSERHAGSSPATGTPGSWNQRAARPNRCVWSIACGAPTSRSSGGRSAVTTSIGTSESAGLDDGRAGSWPPPCRSCTGAPPACRRGRCRGPTNAGDPLVVDDVHGQLGPRRQRQRHRRAARTGGDRRRGRRRRGTSSSTRAAQHVAWATA